MGIKETGTVQGEPCPHFTSPGAVVVYHHLGANIQPGVLGEGGRGMMTEMKRKPGAGGRQQRPDRIRETKATKQGHQRVDQSERRMNERSLDQTCWDVELICV